MMRQIMALWSGTVMSALALLTGLAAIAQDDDTPPAAPPDGEKEQSSPWPMPTFYEDDGTSWTVPAPDSAQPDAGEAPVRSDDIDPIYAEFGLPRPSLPTQERPYYTYTFDEIILRDHPEMSPLHLQAIELDKLLIYNFIDRGPKGRRFSQMQTGVLEKTLKALAPRSEKKDLFLVNVVVANEEDEPVYGAAYLALYEDENRLGPNGTLKETTILPYGVVYGEPLAEGKSHWLMDFSLINGVRTDADLNANANAISGSLADIVYTYNKMDTDN